MFHSISHFFFFSAFTIKDVGLFARGKSVRDSRPISQGSLTRSLDKNLDGRCQTIFFFFQTIFRYRLRDLFDRHLHGHVLQHDNRLGGLFPLRFFPMGIALDFLQ